MKKYDLLTPEGTRDLLFDECSALRSVGERLRRIFISRGFSEVITPGLEFFDVFNNKSRSYSQEALYKLTDAKGRLMVLRPDSTMPIARLVGTRLRSEGLPLKLYYDQTIYRAHPKDSGRDDEFYQCGIEIIGGDIMKSDMEALSIAAQIMEAFDEDDYRLEIGDSAFFAELCAGLGLTEQKADDVRELVISKNYPGLSECLSEYGDNPYAKALIKLPALFGGRDVLEKARAVLPGEKTAALLDRLGKVYENICGLGIEENVTVDLGMISMQEAYYTGIVFKGYVEGYGMPILTGGRYDRLLADFGTDTPATGFAVNENAAAQALLKKSGGMLESPPDVLVFSDEEDIVNAIKHCRTLIDSGMKAEYSDLATLSEAKEYAKRKSIRLIDILSDGKLIREKVHN